MTKRLLERLPSALKDELLGECGGLCPILRCTGKVWDFFPLDANPSNLQKENLLGLCQSHYPMAGQELSMTMLRTIRTLLNRDRFPQRAGSVRSLKTRREYLSEVARHLWTTDDELFIQ